MCVLYVCDSCEPQYECNCHTFPSRDMSSWLLTNQRQSSIDSCCRPTLQPLRNFKSHYTPCEYTGEASLSSCLAMTRVLRDAYMNVGV